MAPTNDLDQLLAERAERSATPVDPVALAIAERLRDAAFRRHARVSSAPEIKAFRVEAWGRRGAFVTIEVGRVGDEGTLAAIVCRDYRHIAIANTARRGLRLLNPAKGFKSKARGFFNVITTPAR
jgi:hypothetical protein